MNRFLKKAYTLSEALITVTVMGILISAVITNFKPNSIKNEALQVAGMDAYGHIDRVTKMILTRHSTLYRMDSLKNVSGTTFTLSDANKNAYISALYKKYLGPNTKTVDATYTDITLTGSLKISNFSNGVFSKNNMYVAFKFNTNCTTTESTVYSPVTPNVHNPTNSCGLILYDVNGTQGPNVLNTDIYIVSVGRHGLK